MEKYRKVFIQEQPPTYSCNLLRINYLMPSPGGCREEFEIIYREIIKYLVIPILDYLT